MKPFRRVPSEMKASRKLKAAIKTHVATQADTDPGVSTRVKEDARRAETKARKQLQELESQIAARKLEHLQGEYLSEAKQRFPESATKSATNRTEQLAELRNYRDSLDDGPECLRAKQYVATLIKVFEAEIKAETQAVEDERRAEVAAQENRDFLAAEKTIATFVRNMRPVFMKPQTLAWRKKAQEQALKLAAEWREIAKTRGNELDETGTRTEAIALANADQYELFAKRIAPFVYDMEWAPSDDELKKMGWLLDLPVEENWIFRGKEEQAQLRVAIIRYRQLRGYSSDDIPFAPAPTKIARDKGSNPPLMELAEVRQEDGRRQLEEQRIARLEKLRIEDPKAFKKLTEDALKPIEVEAQPILYYVQQRTLDKPNLPDLLFWPSGERAIVGRDIHYDFRSKQYFVEEISTEEIWLGPSQKAQQTDEQLERENQLAMAAEFAPFHEHIIRKSRPPVAVKPREKSITPFYRQPLRILQGDHMPDSSDPRHPKNGGVCRWGSWYSKAQCDEADKKAAAHGLHIFDGIKISEPVALATKPDVPTRDSAVWAAHEQKIKQETRDE